MFLLLVSISVLLLFSVPVAADDSVGESNLPSKYDLRDYGLVTPVKYQYGDGSCWAFAIINSIESNAIKQGYESLSTADFSEYQLAYFMYNRKGVTVGDVLPELSGLAGDDIKIKDKSYIKRGGNPLEAVYHLATGIGVVREEVAKYELATSRSSLARDCAVSKNVYILSHASFVDNNDRDDIKQNLMDHGCGVISYFDNSDYFNSYNYYAKYEGKSSTCYYQYSVNDNTNHCVSLVGWDDTYPRENFILTPKNDGAWLLKNSWAKGWGDEGYFWISYEDASLDTSPIIFYEVRPQTEVDTIYQYDGSIDTTYRYAQSTELSAMNKFIAKDYEMITDVSFVTLNKDLGYEASILNEYKEVVSTVSGFVHDCGYYTIPLSTQVKINPGDVFYVKVEFTSSDIPENLFGLTGLSIPVDACADYDWIEMISVAEPDQSYLYYEDIGENYGENLRIKAFAVDRSPDEIGENTTDLSTPISTPAPVAGVLLGLFGAAHLLRRRH